MCILPTPRQKRIFGDWILEIDCWLTKFGQWPVSDVLEQMVAMFSMSDKTKGREAWDLVFRKQSKKKGGSHKEMVKSEPFVVICKMVIWVTGGTCCAIKWNYLN